MMKKIKNKCFICKNVLWNLILIIQVVKIKFVDNINVKNVAKKQKTYSFAILIVIIISKTEIYCINEH